MLFLEKIEDYFMSSSKSSEYLFHYDDYSTVEKIDKQHTYL